MMSICERILVERTALAIELGGAQIRETAKSRRRRDAGRRPSSAPSASSRPVRTVHRVREHPRRDELWIR